MPPESSPNGKGPYKSKVLQDKLIRAGVALLLTMGCAGCRHDFLGRRRGDRLPSTPPFYYLLQGTL